MEFEAADALGAITGADGENYSADLQLSSSVHQWGGSVLAVSSIGNSREPYHGVNNEWGT